MKTVAAMASKGHPVIAMVDAGGAGAAIQQYQEGGIDAVAAVRGGGSFRTACRVYESITAGVRSYWRVICIAVLVSGRLTVRVRFCSLSCAAVCAVCRGARVHSALQRAARRQTDHLLLAPWRPTQERRGPLPPHPRGDRQCGCCEVGGTAGAGAGGSAPSAAIGVCVEHRVGCDRGVPSK